MDFLIQGQYRFFAHTIKQCVRFIKNGSIMSFVVKKWFSVEIFSVGLEIKILLSCNVKTVFKND